MELASRAFFIDMEDMLYDYSVAEEVNEEEDPMFAIASNFNCNALESADFNIIEKFLYAQEKEVLDNINNDELLGSLCDKDDQEYINDIRVPEINPDLFKSLETPDSKLGSVEEIFTDEGSIYFSSVVEVGPTTQNEIEPFTQGIVPSKGDEIVLKGELEYSNDSGYSEGNNASKYRVDDDNSSTSSPTKNLEDYKIVNSRNDLFTDVSSFNCTDLLKMYGLSNHRETDDEKSNFEVKKERDFDGEPNVMEMVDITELSGQYYSNVKMWNYKMGEPLTSLAHDHPYSAPDTERLNELSQEIKCEVESDVSDTEAQPVDVVTPPKVTIHFETPVPVPETRRRGRPRRAQTSTQQTVKPAPAKPRKRAAASAAGNKAKKSKAQNATAKPRNNSKQMSNDKREQHNRAERERRNDLKNNLLALEDLIPQQLLENAHGAINYVKKSLGEEVENDLSVQVMSKLDYMHKNGISGKDYATHKKGTRFPKVAILQAVIFYNKLIEQEYEDITSEILYYENMLNISSQDIYHTNINEHHTKKLKVQNTMSTSRHKRRRT